MKSYGDKMSVRLLVAMPNSTVGFASAIAGREAQALNLLTISLFILARLWVKWDSAI